MTAPRVITDTTNNHPGGFFVIQDVVQHPSRTVHLATVQAIAAAATLDHVPIVVHAGQSFAELREEIDVLRTRIDALEEQLGSSWRFEDSDVIVLRTVDRETAQQEIRKLFAGGNTFYYSEISEKLKIDLETVVEICQELQAAGEIRVDDNAL